MDGLFEAACPGQILASAEVCDAGQVDESCDGAANEGCGCAPIDEVIACCSGRGVQTCLATAGGSAYSACSVAPASETCNGFDDDCDGLVDEEDAPLCGAGSLCVAGACGCPAGALPLGCVVDADGDLFSPDLAAQTPLCPASDRPAQGGCPAGFVLPTFALGLDCNDTDATRSTLRSLRTDQDGDAACVGAATVACSGDAAPAGQRLAGACRVTDDCDDANGAVFALAAVRSDADSDGYCAGAAANDCIGAAPPAGRRLLATCQPVDDCNDASAAAYTLATVRVDGDADAYCIGAAFSQCVGAGVPAGLRPVASCLGDDCRDSNPLATTTCTFLQAYTTNSATKACFLVPPTETFTVSVVSLCPFGFQLDLGSLAAQRFAGTGPCTPVSATSLQMSCNGLDGATCRIVGSCSAL